MQKLTRLKRELEMMVGNPPPGISCFMREGTTNVLDACVMGLKDTAYESGVFKIEIRIPEKYPFEPPNLRFITPVYHPNIDLLGRICLDLLRLPPKGSWRPVTTISGLLTAIQVLLATPNPDDPLMADIAEEYQCNKLQFHKKAEAWTKKYAFQNLNTETPSTEGPGISLDTTSTKRKGVDEDEIPSKKAKNIFIEKTRRPTCEDEVPTKRMKQ